MDNFDNSSQPNNGMASGPITSSGVGAQGPIVSPGAPTAAPGMAPQPPAPQSTVNNMRPIVGYTDSGQPMVQQVVAAPTPKRDFGSLIKTIAIVCLSLISVTFIGLFVWMMSQYNDARTDVDGQIDAAVRTAVDDKTMQLELDFAEREKYPFRTFAGPVDYGELTFEYPKTWSVYISADAAKGGDFQAYFNPIEVNPISDSTINALRLQILNESTDEVLERYQKYVEKKDSNLSVESVTIGDGSITANRYTGTLPDSELSGYVVIFKIRDKTAVIRTDSTLFADDYNTLLSTVRFNA